MSAIAKFLGIRDENFCCMLHKQINYLSRQNSILVQRIWPALP